MKRIVLFYIISLSVAISAHAQQITFSKVFYDVQQSGIDGRAAVNSFDNGYVIAGKGGSDNGFILKIDSVGNEEWNKVIGENVNNYPRIFFNSIIQTNDTCYLLAGSAYNPTNSETEAFCVKINQTGDTLWTKTISPDNYIHTNVQSVYQTSDSGYVMTGYISQNPTPNNIIFVAKIDKQSNLEWTNIIGDGNFFNYGYSIKETPDNGYILVAALQACCPWNYGTFLIKLSSNGSIDWSKKYYQNATEGCAGYDVIILEDGFLCLMRVDNYSALMKTDFAGNIIWSKQYSSYINNDSNWPPPRLNRMPDSSFVFTTLDGMLKVDTSGNPLLSNSFTLMTVGMTAPDDNGFFIFGNGPGLGAKTQVLSPQIGVIKMDSLANFQDCTWPNTITAVDITMQGFSHLFTSVSGGVEGRIHPYLNSLALTDYSGCIDFTGSAHIDLKEGLLIYPNPTTSLFTLTLPLSSKQLNIYNATGQLVQTQQVKNKTTLNLELSENGIYFVQVITDKEIVTEKVVVSR